MGTMPDGVAGVIFAERSDALPSNPAIRLLAASIAITTASGPSPGSARASSSLSSPCSAASTITWRLGFRAIIRIHITAIPEGRKFRGTLMLFFAYRS